MHYLYFLILYLSYMFFFKKIYNWHGYSFFGRNIHPLSGFFILNIFLFSLPGAILTALLPNDILELFNRNLSAVSLEIRTDILFYYLYSITILGLFLVFFSKTLKLPKSNDLHKYRKLDENLNSGIILPIFIMIILQLLYIVHLFNVVGIDNIPIINIFKGDYLKANIVKAQLIQNEI